MSCTVTLDVPQKAAEYVERQGPRYRAELNALFVAIIQTRMQYEDGLCSDRSSRTELDFAADWGLFRIQDGELDLHRTNETLREVDFG